MNTVMFTEKKNRTASCPGKTMLVYMEDQIGLQTIEKKVLKMCRKY